MTQNELLAAVTLLAFAFGLVVLRFSRHTHQIADIKSKLDLDRNHLNKVQDDITSLVLQQDIRNEMIKRLEEKFKFVTDAFVPFRIIQGPPLTQDVLDKLKDRVVDWKNLITLPNPLVAAPQPVPPGPDPLTATAVAYENSSPNRTGNLHQRMKDLLWQWEVLNSNMVAMCNSDGAPIAPKSLRDAAKDAFEASLMALMAEVRRTPAADPPRSSKAG